MKQVSLIFSKQSNKVPNGVPYYSTVFVITDSHNSEGLSFCFTFSSQWCHSFRVDSLKNAWMSGSETWKYLGCDHKCNFGKACAPISRQNNINPDVILPLFFEKFRGRINSPFEEINLKKSSSSSRSLNIVFNGTVKW